MYVLNLLILIKYMYKNNLSVSDYKLSLFLTKALSSISYSSRSRALDLIILTFLGKHLNSIRLNLFLILIKQS